MTDVHGVAVELAERAGLLDKLYELCCVEGSSNASIATKNGDVELLTSLCDFLHGRSLKLLVSALRTLSSIIHDVQSTHTFRQSDGPKIVVDILKDGFQSVVVLENGFSVITTASTANEVLKESFMDLKLDEILVKNGSDEYEQDYAEYGRMLLEMGHAEGIPSKLLKVNLSIGFKFLADLVGKVLLGKHSAHDNINRHQFALMSALVNKKEINWAGLLFDLIRKKNNKKEVMQGRLIGFFLSQKASQLLGSVPTAINASKRIDSSLFSKCKRVIQKPSKANYAPITSESTRASEVASLPSEEILASSSLPSTSIATHSSPVNHPSPPASPTPAHLAETPNLNIDSIFGRGTGCIP
ncbi:hypothetical protein KSP39_PZI004170 [Platanthera zijinensis]|uniref:Uncharacterized protein n=1 Tax=Platanthera zijinensis TaxID=2320716 RepID=A0AAP0BXQ6_9ASPA